MTLKMQPWMRMPSTAGMSAAAHPERTVSAQHIDLFPNLNSDLTGSHPAREERYKTPAKCLPEQQIPATRRWFGDEIWIAPSE